MNWPGFHDHERNGTRRGRRADGGRSEPRFGDPDDWPDDRKDRQQEAESQVFSRGRRERHDPAAPADPDDHYPHRHQDEDDEERHEDRDDTASRNPQDAFAPTSAAHAQAGSGWTREAPQESVWSGNDRGAPLASGGRLLAVLAVLVAGGIFAGILWYSYGRGGVTITSSGSEPPLIHADQSPFKRRPEQPGGMDVPHQDKLVFDRLNPSGATAPAKLEKLRPPPEAPLPRPATPPTPAPSSAPAIAGTYGTGGMGSGAAMGMNGAMNGMTGGMSGMATPKPPATPAPPRPTSLAASGMGSGMGSGMTGMAGTPPATTAAKPATGAPSTGTALPAMAGMGAATRPATSPGVLTPPAPTVAGTPSPSLSGGGGVYVQLGAVRSEAEAQSEWKRLSGRYPTVLGGLPLAVRRADLGDKGIFYRIQGGAVDEARARTICNELKAQNVGCQIVRP